MKPAEIKAAIDEKGFTVSLIAEHLGKRYSTVNGVINRWTTSTEIATAIAKIVGKPVSEVFPDVMTYKRDAIVAQQKQRQHAELAQLLAS